MIVAVVESRLIPVITQGWGGIVVGLISKTAGSVRKGHSQTFAKRSRTVETSAALHGFLNGMGFAECFCVRLCHHGGSDSVLCEGPSQHQTQAERNCEMKWSRGGFGLQDPSLCG